VLHCYFNPSESIGDKQMATYSGSESEESEREFRDTNSAACSVGDGDGVGSGTPPTKKPKRLCNYRAEWIVKFNWCLKVPGNVFAADCNLCRKTVSIGHGGRSDLVQHSKTEGHKKAVRGATTTSVRKFFTNVNLPTGIDRQVGLSRIIRPLTPRCGNSGSAAYIAYRYSP